MKHMTSLILAADIGGTNIRAAIMDSNGKLSHERRQQALLSSPHTSESDVIDILADFFRPLLQQEPALKAIGMGFPGFFIGQSGILSASPNLPKLHQFKLAERLSNTLNIAVIVQNDALCAAVGEQSFGAAQGHQNLLHITLGTGVGGGLILNNTPYTGESGMAMEFGHLRVCHDADANLCGCGALGCVESYASATAISAQYFKLSGVQRCSKDIYKEALSEGTHAKDVIEDAGHKLGMAIAEAVKLLDIHTISISGGFIGAWSLLHPTIMESLNKNLIPPLQGKIEVLPSILHDDAGLLGAGKLANMVVST
ncbi:MAG: ROK family protein [Mariprofundaceae bacterium]|nr:ROK family protein [Mariprofundaceae bacterium]